MLLTTYSKSSLYYDMLHNFHDSRVLAALHEQTKCRLLARISSRNIVMAKTSDDAQQVEHESDYIYLSSSHSHINYSIVSGLGEIGWEG